MKQIRWGVVGTGYIAGNLAECMDFVPEAQKTAVTGTSMEKARAFAEKHGFEAGFDSLEDMLAQAKPDVVYIAVPNHLHFGLVMQALEAGVNVLCEKPMADDRQSAGKGRFPDGGDVDEVFSSRAQGGFVDRKQRDRTGGVRACGFWPEIRPRLAVVEGERRGKRGRAALRGRVFGGDGVSRFPKAAGIHCFHLYP